MTSRPPLLSINKISFNYPNQPLLFHDFSLSLSFGECISLIGGSGIGKSTLLNLISGQEKQHRGELVTYQAPAYLNQQPLLLPWLSALNNVLIAQVSQYPWASISRVKKKFPMLVQKATQLLHDVGIHNIHQRPHELSGGMAQRVALARTIFLERKLWILDEPFSQLDDLTRQTLQELLYNQVKKYDIAILLVTHNIEEAIQLSSKVLCLLEKPIHSPLEFNIDRQNLSFSDFNLSSLKQEYRKTIFKHFET